MENNRYSHISPFVKRFIFIFNIVWTALYLLWRIFYTLPFESGLISIIPAFYLIIVEVLGMFEAMVHYFNMRDIQTHEVPDVPAARMPDVDVLIATYGESQELLFKTVDGCLHMEYPDREKVHIFLCDDGNRPEMRQLAERMGVHYLNRPDHKGAKAGNLNHALQVTSSPLLVTFDADMIPKHDFLMKTIPYFVHADLLNEKHKDDPEWKTIKMGFIQTPQSFYNPDLFQFNLYSEGRIPNEQDYFYRDVQVARNKSNSVIYGGSNTVLSRKALEDVGGFYTKSVTEDFATGILIQEKKYTCYATDEILASGLSPTDLKSLIQQRSRWARGCIQTGRKIPILFSPRLTIAQKVNYLASIFYWYAPLKRLIYIMAPILFADFGIMVVKCTLLQILIFWLPMYLSSNMCLKLLSRNIRTTKWTSIYETILFPFLLIPVILETFGISIKKFKVTRKDGTAEKSNILYSLPHLFLLVLDFIGMVACVRGMFTSGEMYDVVIFFWLLVNLFTLVMSVFFILGRKIHRRSERIYKQYSCRIKSKAGLIDGVTSDFSEGGALVALDAPVYINENEDVEIELDDEGYHAHRKGTVVYVKEVNGKFEYAFRFTDPLNSDYLHLVYDRVPELPKNLDASLSSFDDLRLNLMRRVAKTTPQNRKLPRVHMGAAFVEDTDGEIDQVADFNYEYITVHGADKKSTVLKPLDSISLQCTLVRTWKDGRCLYHIDNYLDIVQNTDHLKELEKWVTENGISTEDYEKKKRRKAQIVDEFSELDRL